MRRTAYTLREVLRSLGTSCDSSRGRKESEAEGTAAEVS